MGARTALTKVKPMKATRPTAAPKVTSPISNDILDDRPPSSCELAVVRCCDARQTTVLPLRCLEVNGCPGLYWQGKRTCSKSLVTKAITALNRRILRRKKVAQSRGSTGVQRRV